MRSAIAPRFEDIEAELAALNELRGKPAGTIRLMAGEHSACTILWPAMAKLLPNYPDIHIDVGARLGEQVAKDMIAVRIGPDMRMPVIAASSYFARRKRPKTPQDLTRHDCR